jgi:hypothetical protein
MRRCAISIMGICALLGVIYLYLGTAVDAAKQAKDLPSCKSCHTDLSAVLPKGHPAVSGENITACAPCHAPDYSGKAQPNAYASGLHRAHEKPGKQVDCTVCHGWIPGKSFTILGQKESLGAPSQEDMVLLKKIFASWTESPYLDAVHAKKDIDCMGCHGKSLPKEGDTVENDRCLACHGPLDRLQAKTAPKDFPDRNPHKSHLGEIACTVCHRAHSESKVYCLECHKTFTMKLRDTVGKQ